MCAAAAMAMDKGLKSECLLLHFRLQGWDVMQWSWPTRAPARVSDASSWTLTDVVAVQQITVPQIEPPTADDRMRQAGPSLSRGGLNWLIIRCPSGVACTNPIRPLSPRV